MFYLRILAVGFIIIMVGSGLVFWSYFGDVITSIIYVPQWRRDFNSYLKQMEESPTEAGAKAAGAIKEAEASGAKLAVLLTMKNQLEQAYYAAGDTTNGDAIVADAIETFPKELLSAKYSRELATLCQCYEDRGWERHKLYLKDRSKASGVPDLERATQLLEKSWGEESYWAAYKQACLAFMYCELGETEKGNAMIARAVKACRNADVREQCGWYVGAQHACVLAMQGKRKEALAVYLDALPYSKNDGLRERMLDMFKFALEFGQPKVNPELKNVRSDLRKGNYKNLDALAKELTASKRSSARGLWLLDEFYTLMGNDELHTFKRNMTDSQYRERIADIERWLKSCPQSAAARISLAEAYIEYAWFARGGGYADSVSEEGWKLFGERIKKAKVVLDGDGKIKEKSPRAYVEYARIALADGMEKSQYLKLVDECHRRFPGYLKIDFCTIWFLLPRWYGEEGESEKYLVKRADGIGGDAGAMAYAQMVQYMCEWVGVDGLFADQSPLKWERAKAGYELIFKAYPDDTAMRIIYMDLCQIRGDNASMRGLF